MRTFASAAVALLLAAILPVPAVEAAPGACDDEAIPHAALSVAVTVHTVSMPSCLGSASCAGCTSMDATLVVEGFGLVSGRMRVGSASGAVLLECAGLHFCTAEEAIPYQSLSFYCDATGGSTPSGVGPVPTLALDVEVRCEVG